jgi:hypothetical protein
MITTVYKDEAWWKGYDSACWRAALRQGLAPMALRLALAGIAFTAERPDGDATVLQVPITPEAPLRVTAAEDVGPDVEDLRWRINLGEPVTTGEAMAIIHATRAKVSADG